MIYLKQDHSQKCVDSLLNVSPDSFVLVFRDTYTSHLWTGHHPDNIPLIRQHNRELFHHISTRQQLEHVKRVQCSDGVSSEQLHICSRQ